MRADATRCSMLAEASRERRLSDVVECDVRSPHMMAVITFDEKITTGLCFDDAEDDEDASQRRRRALLAADAEQQMRPAQPVEIPFYRRILAISRPPIARRAPFER